MVYIGDQIQTNLLRYTENNDPKTFPYLLTEMCNQEFLGEVLTQTNDILSSLKIYNCLQTSPNFAEMAQKSLFPFLSDLRSSFGEVRGAQK